MKAAAKVEAHFSTLLVGHPTYIPGAERRD
jgi:hypothetical protein